MELVKENRKIQKKVDQFDKLLDDFVQVNKQQYNNILLANCYTKSAQPLEDALASELKPEIITIDDDNNVIESMDTTL
jgi:hypothetical protein